VPKFLPRNFRFDPLLGFGPKEKLVPLFFGPGGIWDFFREHGENFPLGRQDFPGRGGAGARPTDYGGGLCEEKEGGGFLLPPRGG